jgi:hypothetical protein
VIRWRDKTNATTLTEVEFEKVKAEHGFYVVGVAGFSGQWSTEKLATDPNVAELVLEANRALRSSLQELKLKHDDRLIVSSGATDEGAPKLAYELCTELSILAMGVTSNRAAAYPLATMNYLIVSGEDWGDESPAFVRTLDELVVLGGGAQTRREAMLAAKEYGKRVTILRGFGGSSDKLTFSDIPGGRFTEREQMS